MRILAWALLCVFVVAVGSTGAALAATTLDDHSVFAKGRGGHDDPPGDDHDGYLIHARGRGGHDDPPQPEPEPEA